MTSAARFCSGNTKRNETDSAIRGEPVGSLRRRTSVAERKKGVKTAVVTAGIKRRESQAAYLMSEPPQSGVLPAPSQPFNWEELLMNDSQEEPRHNQRVGSTRFKEVKREFWWKRARRNVYAAKCR